MSVRDCIHGQLARSCEICELTAELSELRARVERAKVWVTEYDEGDYFVHGKIQPSFYEGVDWAHKNLLAILEGDEK